MNRHQKYVLGLFWALGMCLLLEVGKAKEPNRMPYLPTKLPGESEGYGVNELTELESLYYDSDHDRAERFAQKIYRKITPNVNATPDDFRVSLKSIRSSPISYEFTDMTAVGDIVCPQLYSNNLIEMTDEDLSAIFEEEGFSIEICQAKQEEYTVRIISMGVKQGSVASSDFMENLHYIFIQTWDDTNVWVQPFSELYGHDEIKENFLIKDNENNLYMYLISAYEFPRNGHAVIGYTLKFTGEYWVPCQEEVVPEIDDVIEKYDKSIKRKEGFVIPGVIWDERQEDG